MNEDLFEDAAYRKETEVLFMGNPLIEAVPYLGDPRTEYASKLMVLLPYDKEDRNLGIVERLNKLQYIKQLHVASVIDTEIAMNIDRCLHWGYYSRNPMPMSVVQSAVEEAGYPYTDSMKRLYRSYKAPIYGFPVFGISGVGKTCSVMNVLTNYPQVIVHTNYRGRPFLMHQLVWLKVNCPADGTMKGLCHAILQEIDNVLGTTFSTQRSYNRVSKDIFISDVSAAIDACRLGILVIDDIQSLCREDSPASRELLNFILSLINNADIPIVMVGTPNFIKIIKSEFQQAKRVTGEGEVHMDLLKKGSREWNRYMTTLWTYQYTQKAVPLTDEMADAFYEETFGNQFLLAILYKLVQDNAIISGTESFTVQTVHQVADAKLGLTKEERAKMLDGEDCRLENLEGLWDAPSIPNEVIRLEKQSTETDLVQKLATVLVSKTGRTMLEARGIARQVCAAYPTEKDPDVLYVYAKKLIKRSEKPTEEKGSADGVPNDVH